MEKHKNIYRLVPQPPLKKHNCEFIQLDINYFYPSKTKPILDKALYFAQEQMQICINQLNIIRRCRKSLIDSEDVWWKKWNDQRYNGKFWWSRVFEIIGIHIRHEISKITKKNDIGLYRDECVIILSNWNIRKKKIKPEN